MPEVTKAAPAADKRPDRRRGPQGGPQRGGDRRSPGRGRPNSEPKEYDQKILDLARVTRVTAGGKRMRFRAAVVIGNRKGTIGFGLAKGADVSMAVDKATNQARKHLFEIPMAEQTIPHAVKEKFGAASVLLKPAPSGTGLKSGGAVRVLLELGGVPNAVSKIFGSTNKINVAKATMQALRSLRQAKTRVKKS
ncbi:30S ribosomal protein S5 [Candidatus Uhrbacteria bacterium]|nr:30S ribosomal protein S5 [Candidatus Uhrbacteria bacterium]